MAHQKTVWIVNFFLDSKPREIYTFVSCFTHVKATLDEVQTKFIEMGAQANAT